MSKLAKKIDATFTGQKVASDKPNYLSTELHTREVEGFGIQKQMRFVVKLQKDVFFEDSMKHEDIQFQTAVHDIKRAMIEEVFGEFRPLIIELRASIYDKDLLRVRTLLAELEYQMFVEGL